MSVGTCVGRHLRFRSSGRKALIHSELRPDMHRHYLDTMVLRHQTQKLPVSNLLRFQHIGPIKEAVGPWSLNWPSQRFRFKASYADCVLQFRLAAVNFFLGLVGVIQITRILMHDASKKDTVAGAIEEVKEEVKEKVKA